MPQFALRQRAANRDSHVRLHQGLHTHGDLCIRKVSSRLNSHIGSPMANVHRYPDNNAPRTAGEFRLQPLADRVLSRPVSASETLTHDGHRGRTRPLLPRLPEVRRRRAQGSPQQPRPDGQAGAHRGTGPSGQRVDPAGSQEALQRTGRSHRGHRKERLPRKASSSRSTPAGPSASARNWPRAPDFVARPCIDVERGIRTRSWRGKPWCGHSRSRPEGSWSRQTRRPRSVRRR